MNEMIQKQIEQLHKGGYLDEAATLRELSSSVNIRVELAYLTKFASKAESGDPLAREQLRALWTAYCCHADLLVDTAPYDNEILHLWNEMEDAEQTQGFKDFDDFDNFMCAFLV